MTSIKSLKDESSKNWQVWTKEDGSGRSLLGLAKLALSSFKEENGEMPELMMLDFKKTRVLLQHSVLDSDKPKVKKDKVAKKDKKIKAGGKKSKSAGKVKKQKKARKVK